MRQRIKFRIPYGTLCSYCEIDIANSWDHFIPHSKGGNDTIENLVPACMSCNIAASNLIFDTLADKREYVKNKRFKGMIVSCPKIIKPVVKIMVLKPNIMVTTVIRNGKICYDQIIYNSVTGDPMPMPSPKICRIRKPKRWVQATHENALLLAF